jgi:hypothetical protein
LIPFSYERGVSRPGPPGVTAGHLEYYSGVSYCLGGLVLAVVGDVPGVGKLLPRVALVLLSGFSFFCFVGVALLLCFFCVGLFGSRTGLTVGVLFSFCLAGLVGQCGLAFVLYWVCFRLFFSVCLGSFAL